MRALLLGILFLMSPVMAGETGRGELQDLPEPPDLPDQVESGETIEPEVTIIQREDRTIEEYSINGRTYMIKVIPNVGPPYYFVDNDGDGKLETRVNDVHQDMPVPQWVIFSW